MADDNKNTLTTTTEDENTIPNANTTIVIGGITPTDNEIGPTQEFARQSMRRFNEHKYGRLPEDDIPFGPPENKTFLRSYLRKDGTTYYECYKKYDSDSDN